MAQGSVAQTFNETIVGCAEVDCPTASGSTAAECKLDDKTFSMIGLAKIDTNETALEGLSWVEGVAVSDSDGGNRTFDKSFYLGTPSNFSLDGTGACALFFTHVSDRVMFGEKSDDVSTTQGTCAEALSDDCVEALISHAEGFNVTGDSTNEDTCKKLQKDFEDNFDKACGSFADGKTWVNLKYTTLSGSGGVEPISAENKTSSECWPIVPKADNLSFVRSIETTGDYLADTLSEEYYGITPILTFFFPGDSKLVSKTTAQLTCMKTIGTSDGTNSTQSDGSKDQNNGSGSLAQGGHAVMGLVIAMAVFLLV